MSYQLEFYLAGYFPGEQHAYEAAAEKETTGKSQKFYHVAWLYTFLLSEVDKQYGKVADHASLSTICIC